MTGIKKGFQGKATDIAPHVKLLHCITHRQAIAAKKLEPGVHKVLQDDISVVNFIKTSPSNSSIFTRLCKEMGCDHENLLHHAEVCWVSCGKVLKRVVKLYTFFFYKKRSVPHLLTFLVMAGGCE